MTNKNSFHVRLLTPSDGSALGDLLAKSPDTGSLAVAMRFELNTFHTMCTLRPGSLIYGADSDKQELVGSGALELGDCQWEGRTVPFALQNTLVVHPEHRRQGIAARLIGHHLERADQHLQGGGVLWAIIQQQNRQSESAARKWATAVVPDRMVTVTLPMRPLRPACNAPGSVRPPAPNEMTAVAEQLNRYYSRYNLYTPTRAEALDEWLGTTPFSSPFRHYRIATDASGNIVAGLAVTENYRLQTVAVLRLPPHIRLANRYLGIVARNGDIRAIRVTKFWHGPGQENRARELLDSVRQEWAGKASAVVLALDRHAPLMSVLPWYWRLCKSVSSVVLRTSIRPSGDRLYYFP
jgi:GNAT superfamily N-acetyltransferase